jgi:geranylgeranyl reductase family protein
VSKYDVAVVGAGPSGSTTAYHLAKAGAKVILIDRARFPRDKPCGGGVTVRAFLQAPVDLTPVVEQVISRVRFSFRLGRSFDYAYPKTLVYMTQRLRLDAFLAESAASAGAVFRDGSIVRGVEFVGGGVRLDLNGETVEAGLVVGADGSNGAVAKAAGLRPVHDPPVALEANFPYPNGEAPQQWRDLLAIELGSMHGGYGWSFPKADHFNVGCGGFPDVGGKLRGHLKALQAHYGLDATEMENVRGHHLPTRDEGTSIVSGRALLVGDAAGLVDPMSGEGIYSAFVSGRLAAEAAQRYLDGRETSLASYERAVERELMPDIRAATLLRDAYHYTPRPCYWAIERSNILRRALCQLITGEKTYDGFVKQLWPVVPFLRFWASRGRLASRA